MRNRRNAVKALVVLGLLVLGLAIPGSAMAQAGPWHGEYWNNPWLSGLPIAIYEHPELHFNWADGSPDYRIAPDHWSARWTGTLNLQAGVWRFTTETDDGVRLFIDGRLVLDKWYDQSRTQHTVDVELSEGVHHVRMEYYEAGGLAFSKLNWDFRGVPAKGGNIITAVRNYGSSWIKVYRWEGGKWLDVNPRGYGRIDGSGYLKLDGFPVDMGQYAATGHPYRVELWADGALIRSVGDTARGEPAFRVWPGRDNLTPWQVPAP